MALGPSGRRASRHAPVLYPEERSSRVAINAENSASIVESFRRERVNVRPYVRTSTQKLKWTYELHQCFMLAVEKLGGQNKATPKRILQHMSREGITIAHIKSHLQMFRSGKINAEGLSKSDYKMWQGGQWQSNNGRPVISYEPAQPKSRFEELSENLDFEPAMALIQLREDSGRSSDSGASAGELLRGSPDNRARFQPYVHKKSKAIKQLAENVATGSGGFVVEVNDKHNAQSSTNREQELHQQDLGHSSTHQPNPWPSTSGDPFLCEASAEHPVDVTDSLSGRKRKTEEIIELNLTMATRSPRPSLQFVSPPTPEEAALSLALS